MLKSEANSDRIEQEILRLAVEALTEPEMTFNNRLLGCIVYMLFTQTVRKGD